MDRDNRWERVEKAYAAMVYGEGNKNSDPVKTAEQSYENGVTDEFIVPTVCAENAAIKANDSVVFFNFRPDRARETRARWWMTPLPALNGKNGRFPAVLCLHDSIRCDYAKRGCCI